MKKKKITLDTELSSNPTAFSQTVYPKYEFHISKEVRKKYNVDDELFSLTGNVLFADFRAVRSFVKKINEVRDPQNHISSGQLNAAGLIDEIYHYIFRLYEVQANPGVFKKALNHLNENIGEDAVRKILFEFISLFPAMDVYRGKISSIDYLISYTERRPNTEITIEELILLYFANFNPANKILLELFDENYFSDKQLYTKVIDELNKFFLNEKKFGPGNQDIFTMLKTPIMKNPENIEAQLDFIRDKWGILLDESFLKRILKSKDLIREDYSFQGFGGGGAPSVVPKYKGDLSDADFLKLGKSGYRYALDSSKDYDEPEKFTRDIDWMPRVVVMAKNVYVWMDQLSKKYQRYIRTLDQIPDEELDLLAQWNFNGLWLIGIWERSGASKKIKHIMGNIDAVSSAYSLYDYQIANDLGGEEAYNNLNSRAKTRGIRLASDMVPNHTGIYSKWVIEHPDYFIQTNYSPFPGYSFTGADLSDDSTVQIRIEDGYWRKSDAAVVFQRIDNNSGEVRYIYHGNDGTNMPWNDTAQLNMTRLDVREAVIQKIMDVARKFSIIRFDAAMTLTKRHFSRLWFPEPGRGGDIPSRVDHAMTKEEFDSTFPEEFWREVVDRINTELPDTLLLAEAFWLMEGYFVRTLGMHRVYNSAFMHMLMKEENAKYRDLISNTLEFEPEILKRYVNFMSNPDEETAIKQFGVDDKYFGVCILMVTLPGLPMFAHGQIEGYTEKYGMEYQRAYYHEVPNQWLIDRHQREIFPLMKKRYLFSQVINFWLFDFIENNGSVNENVFAFTNSNYGERALVLYNNKYGNTSGRIFHSSQKLTTYNGTTKANETKTIADALNINPQDKHFYIYREHVSNLEFIKSGRDIAANGLYFEIGAFKYSVFLDWHEVYDTTGEYEKLDWKLGGKGVHNIERALKEMKFESIHSAFENMFDDQVVDQFIKTFILEDRSEKQNEEQVLFFQNKFSDLLINIKNLFGLPVELKPLIDQFDNEIVSVRELNKILEENFDIEMNPGNRNLHKSIMISSSTNYRDNSILFMLWLVISSIKELFPETGDVNKSNYFEKILLDSPVGNILHRLGRGEYEIYREISLINILQDKQKIKCFVAEIDPNLLEKNNSSEKNCLLILLDDKRVREFISVNEFENTVYFSKENFNELIEWLLTLSVLDLMNQAKTGKHESINKEAIVKNLQSIYKVFEEINVLSARSEYKLEDFKDYLRTAENIIN
jgi:glycosidase